MAEELNEYLGQSDSQTIEDSGNCFHGFQYDRGGRLLDYTAECLEDIRRWLTPLIKYVPQQVVINGQAFLLHRLQLTVYRQETYDIVYKAYISPNYRKENPIWNAGRTDIVYMNNNKVINSLVYHLTTPSKYDGFDPEEEAISDLILAVDVEILKDNSDEISDSPTLEPYELKDDLWFNSMDEWRLYKEVSLSDEKSKTTFRREILFSIPQLLHLEGEALEEREAEKKFRQSLIVPKRTVSTAYRPQTETPRTHVRSHFSRKSQPTPKIQSSYWLRST